MNKKEVRKKIVAALVGTIKELGLSKSGKKIEKLIDRTAAKLATRVESALKKDSKKIAKKVPAKKKSVRAKKVAARQTRGAAPVSAS